MGKQGERVGNFTSVTTPLVIGSVATIAILGAVRFDSETVEMIVNEFLMAADEGCEQ